MSRKRLTPLRGEVNINRVSPLMIVAFVSTNPYVGVVNFTHALEAVRVGWR